MDSFLITGPTVKTKEYIFDLLKKEKIDKLDITLVESEKSVGIALVKELQKKLFLKPFKSSKKAVILSSDLGFTTEAQNSLLKVLEEPPANTMIILLSQTLDEILPTIISRCRLIELEKETPKNDFEKAEKILLSFKDKGIGERLKIAQDYSKDRETALNFINELIYTSENLLKKSKDMELVRLIRKLHEAQIEIKNTNTNLRLLMEHFLLSV